jgi:hypothetical protein
MDVARLFRVFLNLLAELTNEEPQKLSIIRMLRAEAMAQEPAAARPA